MNTEALSKDRFIPLPMTYNRNAEHLVEADCSPWLVEHRSLLPTGEQCY